MLVQSAGVSSNTSGEIRDCLGTANIGRFDPLNRETGVSDQFGDRPVQMATIGDSLLQRRNTVLPLLNVGVGGCSVFHEVKRATRTNDTTELSERCASIGNRAQGEGENARVTAVVFKR